MSSHAYVGDIHRKDGVFWSGKGAMPVVDDLGPETWSGVASREEGNIT